MMPRDRIERALNLIRVVVRAGYGSGDYRAMVRKIEYELSAALEALSDPIASGTPEAGKAVEVTELLASRPSGNVPDKGAPK